MVRFSDRNYSKREFKQEKNGKLIQYMDRFKKNEETDEDKPLASAL
jgi:hypothetical protein